MLAGFAAAYMSTIGTHINLGASYLINDFYKRFLKKDGDERHYARVIAAWPRCSYLLAAVATYYMDSIQTRGSS